MFRAIIGLALALVALEVSAADVQVHRDLAYTEPADGHRTLDLYAPGEGRNHPVLVWIHGGGWRRGDKAAVQHKPDALVKKGFVFVSVNYRFVPQVAVKDQAADVAKAIAWVHAHARQYGASPEAIFVAGHSAGAHLAALVSTDDRYLKAEGLSLADIKGCIPVDTATYDIPAQVQSVSGFRSQLYTGVFGADEAGQKELSPIRHVNQKKHLPPFLVLHVADRPDSRGQSEAFAKALRAAGGTVKVIAAKGKTHGTINRDLGLKEDEPTRAVFQFLKDNLKGAK